MEGVDDVGRDATAGRHVVTVATGPVPDGRALLAVDGRPAPAGSEVAFAAVDEALLELQPNASWNLLREMFPDYGYRGEIATSQQQVVGKRHYGRKALPPGGGGGKEPTHQLLDTLFTWQPAVKLDARGLQLNRLFPAVESTRSSFGRLAGNIDLQGRGNSAARMLGTASGDVALLMGQGQISNLLLEIAGLDGGEIIKFLLRGDRNVQLRCAAAATHARWPSTSTRRRWRSRRRTPSATG